MADRSALVVTAAGEVSAADGAITFVGAAADRSTLVVGFVSAADGAVAISFVGAAAGFFLLLAVPVSVAEREGGRALWLLWAEASACTGGKCECLCVCVLLHPIHECVVAVALARVSVCLHLCA